ncbi:MAG: hypothetical protein N3B10_04310 [Armatimonadetes bacterium]|nr:hypothetical protein [Armatimonadota bacterium]
MSRFKKLWLKTCRPSENLSVIVSEPLLSLIKGGYCVICDVDRMKVSIVAISSRALKGDLRIGVNENETGAKGATD